MLNSKDTKEKYIREFNNTKIVINEPIENIRFNLNFVYNPFFEILGNSNDIFTVEFYDNGVLIHTAELTCNMWTKLNRNYFTEWNIIVKKNNEIIYNEMLNLKNKRVYVSFESSSLGDSIAWVPYLEEFRKKHDCELVVSTFWNKLYEKSYPDIEFVEPATVVNNLYAMYYLGWFYDSNKEPVLPNTIPLQQTATNLLGLDFVEIKPNMDFIPKEKSITGKYVTIANESTAGLKYWNYPNGWQEVVDYLVHRGYKVINVSKNGDDLNKVTKLKDTSIENTMNVIHHSEFFIGLSSGLSWLAWALNKEIIMISNFTEAEHEFSCHRPINKTVCHGCWNKAEYKFDRGDYNWCPVNKNTEKQFECQMGITPSMIITEIKKII